MLQLALTNGHSSGGAKFGMPRRPHDLCVPLLHQDWNVPGRQVALAPPPSPPEPDYAASKIVRAIRCNQQMLLMPLAVHLTPIVRLLPVPIFDEICKWFGVHDTMADFKGRQ